MPVAAPAQGRVRGAVAAVVACVALSAGGASAGQDTAGKGGKPARVGGVDLRRCLDLADRNHPQLLGARAKVAQTRAKLIEAYFAPFMQFRAFGGMSLAPTVRGSNVFSPNTDESLTSSLGVAWRFGVDGVLPLWTFGKITNLWDAAEADVRIKKAGVGVARDAVRLDVRRAYFGLQLARDALDLLKNAEGKMNKAVDALQKDVDADNGDPIDLLKLQTYAAELPARKAEAEKYEQVARAGLRFYTGMGNLDIPDVPLTVAKHKLGGLSRYLLAARVYRPEVLMARAGVAAREAQVRLSRSKLFPDIGLGLSAGLSAAPQVADQINPFVSDGGNYFHYGIALVFQWRLDIVPAVARVAYAEAQLQEMLALDRKALGGVAAQVETAYAEVIDWKKRLDAYRKASKYARKWLSTVQMAIDIGTMEEKDLIDPAKAWAQHHYSSLNATMEYNIALSKLAQATGWDAIAPGS